MSRNVCGRPHATHGTTKHSSIFWVAHLTIGFVKVRGHAALGDCGSPTLNRGRSSFPEMYASARPQKRIKSIPLEHSKTTTWYSPGTPPCTACTKLTSSSLSEDAESTFRTAKISVCMAQPRRQGGGTWTTTWTAVHRC